MNYDVKPCCKHKVAVENHSLTPIYFFTTKKVNWQHYFSRFKITVKVDFTDNSSDS